MATIFRRGGDMRVKEILAALGRRWWLVLIGLLTTGGLVYSVFQYYPATYQITSRILLLPPKSTVLETGNPYLQLGGLREAVDMLGVSLSTQTTLLDLKQISKVAKVEVGADPAASAPILLIDVQDPSPEAALLIRDRLLSLVDERLDGLQQGIGVPVANRVTSTIVSSDVEAEEVGRDQLRAAVAVAVAGAALTLVLAVVLDAAILRRRERRRLQMPSDEGGESGEETERVDDSEGSGIDAPEQEASPPQTSEASVPHADESEPVADPAGAVIPLSTTNGRRRAPRRRHAVSSDAMETPKDAGDVPKDTGEGEPSLDLASTVTP